MALTTCRGLLLTLGIITWVVERLMVATPISIRILSNQVTLQVGLSTALLEPPILSLALVAIMAQVQAGAKTKATPTPPSPEMEMRTPVQVDSLSALVTTSVLPNPMKQMITYSLATLAAGKCTKPNATCDIQFSLLYWSL